MLDLKKLLTKILQKLKAHDVDYITGEAAYAGGTGNTSWRYRKWASGRIEAWAEVSLGSNTGTVWTSPIHYVEKTITFPSGLFSSAPSNIFLSGGGSQWTPVGAWNITATGFTCRFIKPSSSAQNLWVRVYAIKY